MHMIYTVVRVTSGVPTANSQEPAGPGTRKLSQSRPSA